MIGDDTKALQCDRCQGSRTWKCADCLSFSDDMYDRLMSEAGHNLKWFCDQCEIAVTNRGCTTDCQSGKLDQLIQVIEKLMVRYDDIEKSLAAKCDSGRMVKLEDRIQAIEDRLSRVEIGFDHRAQHLDVTVEDRLQSLESKLAASSSVPDNFNDHVVTDEVLIKCAVQEEVKRKTEEDKDLEARRNNVIIFRVPERTSDDVKQRKSSDETFVKDLMDCVFDMKLDDNDLTQMYRLGRWDENKPRPLLVTFRNYDQKEEIMSNLRNLKQPVEKFRGISISHDFHPKKKTRT